MTKSSVLGVLLLSVLLAFIGASQTWYQVSMSGLSAEEELTLKTFAGYSAYGWITPLLLVALVSLLVAAISANRLRLLSLILGLIASASLFGFTLAGVLNQDLSNAVQDLETATGIAATHGIDGLTVVTQAPAYFQLVALGLLVAGFGYSVVAQRTWLARIADNSAAKRGTGSKGTGSKGTGSKDPISLWDQQR